MFSVFFFVLLLADADNFARSFALLPSFRKRVSLYVHAVGRDVLSLWINTHLSAMNLHK